MAKTTKSAGNAGAAGAADATQLAQILGSLETQETPPHPQDTAEDPPIGGSSPTPEASGAHYHTMEITPPGRVRYESRISIVEAWQYPGNLTGAPAWIDRNWIGYADEDDLRGIPAGPCLRVPSVADASAVVLCRVGDYVAMQSVQLAPDAVIVRVEVWAQEQFQKLFIPVANNLTSTPPATPARVGVDPVLDEYASQ